MVAFDRGAGFLYNLAVSLRFLEGPQLILRPLTREDLTPNYVQWLNDEKVCEFNSHAVFPYTAEQMQDYYLALAGATRKHVVLAIVDKQTSQHIGNVSLQNLDWVARNAEFAILLGEKSCWGKGVGKEAGRLIVDYGFQRLNLHRVYCGTSADNLAMQKLAPFLRMREEGRRRQAIYKNGKFSDVIEYGVLREEFYAGT